jgi:hypothetical protein
LVGLAVATGSDLVMVASYLEMLVGRPSPGEAYADRMTWRGRDLVGAAAWEMTAIASKASKTGRSVKSPVIRRR